MKHIDRFKKRRIAVSTKKNTKSEIIVVAKSKISERDDKSLQGKQHINWKCEYWKTRKHLSTGNGISSLREKAIYSL